MMIILVALQILRELLGLYKDVRDDEDSGDDECLRLAAPAGADRLPEGVDLVVHLFLDRAEVALHRDPDIVYLGLSICTAPELGQRPLQSLGERQFSMRHHHYRPPFSFILSGAVRPSPVCATIDGSAVPKASRAGVLSDPKNVRLPSRHRPEACANLSER